MAAFFPQTALCLNRLATEGVTDFAALETALLAALKHDGARWLEELLNDPALPYFIGSGVVEAGCKTVVGQRLKLSGMLWSRKGASDLLTVRCALLSGWFESFWTHQSNPAPSVAFAA